MKKGIIIALILLSNVLAFSQFKITTGEINLNEERFENIGDVTNIRHDNPHLDSNFDESSFFFNSMERKSIELENLPNLKTVWTLEREIPLAIYGKNDAFANEDGSIIEKTYKYLNSIKDYLGVDHVESRFKIIGIQDDILENGKDLVHVRLKQFYKGIPVYGGEIMVHFKEGSPYFLNGFWYPETPLKSDELISRSNFSLKEIVINDLGGISSFRTLNSFEKELLGSEQWSFEKVYYKADEEDELKLCWKVTVHPNLGEEWMYFVGNRSGKIENKFQQICKFHHDDSESESVKSAAGGETGFGIDLLGQNRELNVYKHGGDYFLMDASRSMYTTSQGTMPNDPVGVIWTLDAENSSPENDNFNVEQIHSSNNTWNNRTAVSAHYNAQQAYDYYKNTFSRNSINGQGGNIISLINVTEKDGSQMDNAFWSGKAMFYGNGKDAFDPLAGSLDVAGHEMTHGVIQSTANLEYRGEPGAINESYADVFGCMIDRDDWKLGEDVVFTSVFNSGALRDMSNPHNGGSSLGQAGYQPAHVNEQYHGQEDNGGVHINSGIPNYAYYKFATTIGKNKAEQIYYKALTSYLTKSSRFVDLRVAIEQAAFDLYGANEKQAASDAFEAVGIKGGSSSGGNNDYQDDLKVNPGDDFIVYYNDFEEKLVLATAGGNIMADPFSTTPIISKPSVSDNGSEIVFVGEDRKIHYIYIDWDALTFEESIIQDEAIWRNVIVSKDGWRIAAITEALDNKIHIYDFGLSQWNEFDIYNPTTVEGITAGAVDYIDMMEFNYSGEWIIYDAKNTIKSEFGSDIEYWDVGFVQVFNNGSTNFADGLVQKLFSGLPENTSIGNPTFSKNSPYIVAFDYLVGNNEYYILGSNLETGAVSQIIPANGLGYPNYSRQDDKLLFDYSDFWGSNVAVLDLDESKIAYVPNSDKILFADGTWGTWFSNGTRPLVLSDGIKLQNISEKIVLSPNPSTGKIFIEGDNLDGEYQYSIIDVLGNVYTREMLDIPSQGAEINLDEAIQNGIYILIFQNKEKTFSKKLILNR